MAYKIEVDHETCIGCGSCEQVAGDFFELKEKDNKMLAFVKKAKVDELNDDLNSAKDSCPVGAIKFTE